MSLLAAVETYVREKFQSIDEEKFIYHSIRHTKEVVSASKRIAAGSGLSEKETELVAIAAWFHDIGYIDAYNDHETRSIEIARRFLQENGMDPSDIEIIEGCIEATRVPQSPKSLMEEILCDADMYHMSQPEFYEKSVLLRTESNQFRTQKTGKIKFMKESLHFLENPYFTEYAKKKLTEGKRKNHQAVSEKIKEQKAKKKEKPLDDSKLTIQKLKRKNEELKVKLLDKKPPIRGIDSMFRLTARNQINLSSIADNKSNILITVTSLIISVIISALARKYYELPHLIIPASIFILVCLVTMIFAILSTRPNISGGRFTEDDIKNKKINLLFFGNFYRMKLDEYDWAIREMLKDDEHFYRILVMDQYSLGKVLAKKYRLLRTAYTVFMYGFIVTILAFAIAMTTYGG